VIDICDPSVESGKEEYDLCGGHVSTHLVRDIVRQRAYCIDLGVSSTFDMFVWLQIEIKRCRSEVHSDNNPILCQNDHAYSLHHRCTVDVVT